MSNRYISMHIIVTIEIDIVINSVSITDLEYYNVISSHAGTRISAKHPYIRSRKLVCVPEYVCVCVKLRA